MSKYVELPKGSTCCFLFFNGDACESVPYLAESEIKILVGARDYAKATKLYGKACELKSPIGCAFLGAFYRDGRGVAQSYEKAAEIFTKACEIDSGNGCYDLAELHEGRPRRRARHKNGDEISRQSLRARRPQGLR